MTAERIVVVTGGSRGIGLATVKRLLEEGYSVAACSRSPQDVVDLARSARVLPFAADLATRAGVDSLGDWLRDSVLNSETRLCGWVNSAAEQPRGRHDELTELEWRRGLEVKLIGYYRCSTLAADLMDRGETANSIVNVAGIMAVDVMESYRRSSAMGAAVNAAIIAMSKVLSKEMAPLIRVNCVSPGSIATGAWSHAIERGAREWGISNAEAQEALEEDIPMGRPGEPAEVASAIEFLLSSRSSYITGAHLVVDGGVTRSIW